MSLSSDEFLMNPAPIRFVPQLLPRLWGSESWEVSPLRGNESVVADGDHKGLRISELYPDFPLLLKFLDARDDLSIQVHPSDELARRKYGACGKTEMWYIVAAQRGACIWLGFNRVVSRAEYECAVGEGRLVELLEKRPVKAGEAYFVPAGTIHSIGRGVLLAEVQQPSDITYRIDDWGRTDAAGKPRELHAAEALEAIDFSAPRELKITLPLRTPWFSVDLLALDGARSRPIAGPYLIYMCTAGSATINGSPIEAGQTLLLPAALGRAEIAGKATLLEIH